MKKTGQNQEIHAELPRFTCNLSPLTRIMYLVFCILFSAFLFADTWLDTTTSDFSGGAPADTQVTSDSVQMAVKSDWWNPAQSWWNPAQDWWNTSWQYRKALTINNAGSSTLTDYQVKVENPVYNETGLVGSWHLDGGITGSIANGTTTGMQDTSGYLNNATASNTNGSGMQWASGKFDGAIDFDGTDDYADAGDPLTASLDFGTNDFTVEAWMKADTLKRGGIVSKFRDGGSWYPGYALIFNADGTVVWYISASGSGIGQYSTGVLTAGTWYHLTLVKRSNTAYFYINAALDNSLSANYNVDNSYSLWIGSTYNTGGNEYFDGLIDDVRIYNRALGIDEIQTRYNARAKLNYGDIRFTNSTGTELPYWMEKDGSFWVKSDSIPVGFSTVYMYYGNSSAAASGSISSTFIVGDEFNDITSWTQQSGVWSASNGIVTYPAGTGFLRYNSELSTANDYIVEAKAKGTGNLYTADGVYILKSTNPLMQASGIKASLNIDTNSRSPYIYVDGAINYGTYDSQPNVWYILKTIVPSSGNPSAYVYDVNRNYLAGKTASDASASASNYFGLAQTESDAVTADWFVVRKYASVEPVVFAGSEVSSSSQWTYRKAVTINNAGSALSDFQVKIEKPVYDETGLAGSWHFDEGAGTTVSDMSGCGNIGTLTNGPAWTAGGRVDNALSFDGTDDYITIPDSSYWNLAGGWSVAFWIKPSDLAASRVYYGRSADDSLNGGENYLYYQTSAPAGISWGPINSEWDTGATLTVSQWQYITMVYNALTGKAYCYVDGQQRASVAVTSVGSSTGPFKIADNYNGNHFIGLMDEFRVYNRALSADEIAARFSAKAKLNYSDIRFAGNTGTEIPSWMEKDGTFWLRMDSVPAGLTGAFMYYGNSTATAVSSGTAVFYLFDDFNDKSFDSSKWDIGTGSSVTETDGVLKVTNNGATTPTSVLSKTYTVQNAVMEAKMKWVSTTGTAHMGFIVRDSVQLLTRGPANNDYYWNDGSQKGTLSYSPPQDTWHFLRSAYSGVNGYGYLKNISTGNELTSVVNNLAVTSSGKCGLLVWTSTTDWFDDVRVRQYAAIEPVCTIGSEVISTSRWLYRRQLTVTNNSSSSTLPAGYTTGVDMGLASLVAAGKTQADADDAVIVYNDPSSGMNYELDRTIDTGKAIVFDGVDDYVTAPDSADWDLTASDGTMAFWVKPVNLASVVAHGFLNQVNNTQDWCAYVYSTGSVGIGRAGINEIVTPTGAIINNVWQHIAFVKSGGTTYIYVNGAQAGSGGVSWWTNPVNPFKIGGHVYSSTNYYYNGAMDEVAFFKRALNTTEISELYNSGIPKPLPMTSVGADANLVAYYPFDGDCGDHSTKGNNSTVVNGTYFTEGRVLLVPDLKQGVYFDGTNDYISVAHASNLTFDKTNSFSLEAWVKTASAAGYPTIIRKAKSTPNYEGYWLRLYNSTGKLSMQMYGTNGSRLGRYGSTNLADNAWHHVAVTYDGSSTETGIKLYVDGAEQSYTADSSGTVDSMINTQPLVIGGDSAYWNGIIDDAAVYNRALSAPEISSAYNGGMGTRVSAVSTSGLTGYWDFDGLCADKSGNNNNGIVLNGAFFTTGKLLTTGANKINFKTLADISASSSNATDYFLYYGNTGASVPPANINNVYLLADDFNDGLDNGWVRSVGTWALEGGEYSQSDTASGDTNANYPIALNTALQCKLRMRWLAAGASGDFGIHIFDSAQTGGGRGNSYLMWETRSANQLIIYESSNDTLTQRGTLADTAPVQYLMNNYTITYDPSSGALSFKHEETGNTLSWTDTTPLTSGSYISLRTNTAHVHYDDLKIYKYIAAVPAVSSGAEQLPYQSTGTFISGIKDAGVNDATIDTVNWNTTGAGAVTMEVRAGNTTAGWTDSSPAWEGVTNGDTSVTATGRYIQYRATLTGSGASAEPVLTDVAITYTVPIIPPVDSVSCNKSAGVWYSIASFTFTNDTGFGAQIDRYYYAWDTSSSHTFTLTESVWNSSTPQLQNTAIADGEWYFHYLPYSSTDTAGSAQDMGPFRSDGTAPAMPQLTSPGADASVAESAPSFTWDAVSDTSGVAYTLQVDNYSNFNLPFVNKPGLSSASYTLTGIGQEILVGSSTYYWRVSVVDGAGNYAVSAYRKFTTPSTVPYISNPGTGEVFATLQDAVDSVNTMDGDVITVQDTIAHAESITISKDIVLENAVLAPASGYAVTGQGASGGEILRNCVITKGGISNLALGENLTIFNSDSSVIVIADSHLINCLIEYGTVITNSTLENCDLAATSDYFVSASTGDLRLLSTAVNAIDKGKNLSAEFTGDISGNARGVDVLDISNFDSSAWDIGAHEFVLDAGYSDVTITVIESPVVYTNPTGFVFNAQYGTPITLLTQTMEVSKETSVDFDWTLTDNVEWLSVSPASGTCGTAVSVTVTADIGNLNAGMHEAVITLTSGTAINVPLEIPVDVVIYESQGQEGYAVISTNLSSVDFYAQAGSNADLFKQLTVSNTGTVDMMWSLTESLSWLTADVSGGSLAAAGTQSVMLTADTSWLTAGSYSGEIVLTSAEAINSPVAIGVTVTVPDDTGSSQQTPVLLITPAAPVLLSPSNGTADISAAPLLTWESITGATYWMQVGKDMNFSELAVNRVVETAQYQTYGMEEGVVYYWHVKAVNGAGMSEWSDTYWYRMQSGAADDAETPKVCFLTKLRMKN